jgi:iron complex outermembrane recepter protein
MKTPSKAGRVATTDPQQNAFSPNPIAAACAVLLFAVASVNAQQADPVKTEAEAKAKAAAEAKAKAQEEQKKSTDLGSVTVTGIRRGIEEAISVKKNSDSIVEAVSAEDIGKLPDTSIAESIARLPGLAAQRVAGRAQVISVRGLSPDFATTLLNGREQVSTGDNRGVEFDQYPSELLSGVTVYKTPDAGLIGQGLSGTLDLQTVRPLAFNKRTMAFNVRGERNSLGSGVDQSANGNRVSATYIDQFANRTLGLALGYAHLDSPILSQEYGQGLCRRRRFAEIYRAPPRGAAP